MSDMARWRSFDIVGANYTRIQAAMHAFFEQPTAPLLERVRLRFNADYGSADYPYAESANWFKESLEHAEEMRFSEFLSGLPSLKHLTLGGAVIVWETLHLQSSLTILELARISPSSGPSYAQFKRIVNNLPHLRELALWQAGPTGKHAEWENEPLELPSLTTLTLKKLKPEYLDALVFRMNMPSLTSLELDSIGSQDDPLVFDTFIQPHPIMHCSIFSKLESLAIREVSCDDETVDDAYVTLNSLKDLEAIYGDWAEALGVEPFRCPKLESLTVFTIPEEFDAVLKRRKEQGKPLSLLQYQYGSLSTRERNRLLQYVDQIKRHDWVNPDPEIFEEEEEESDDDDDQEEDENDDEEDEDEDEDDEEENEDSDVEIPVYTAKRTKQTARRTVFPRYSNILDCME